jgi:hypothetical protein
MDVACASAGKHAVALSSAAMNVRMNHLVMYGHDGRRTAVHRGGMETE